MNSKKIHKLSSLLSAAALLPGIVSADESDEEKKTLPEGTEVRFQFYHYQDEQSGNEDRMKVNAPLAYLKLPFSESTEVQITGVFDAMSGASPLYHNTLTGASGIGVEDERGAVDGKITQKFDGWQVSVGTEYSDEDDYESLGFTLETQTWTEDRNTTYHFGVSNSADDITSTNQPDLDENRDTVGIQFGVTQILTKFSILQSNFTYVTSDGYHSDQYKLEDNRPGHRDKYIWLSRLNTYIESLDAALHTDYRFFIDSWGVLSNTLEFKWYQPIGKRWLIRPNLRYYTQGDAEFYSQIFPPEGETHYTADHRLGAYGGLTTGLRLEYALSELITINAHSAFTQQRPAWRIGGEGSDGLKDFYYYFVGGGIALKW